MKKAIIYLRVSTGKQATEGASLDVQKKMCQEWAFRNDLLVDKIYHDDGASAKTLERPELKKMLEYINENKGRISYLVTYQTDRLSRNVSDFYALLALLAKQGVEYKNVNSRIEADINNELVLGIEAVMAQHDNKVKSVRVKDNMKAKAKSGYRMSKTPLGLKNARDVLNNSIVAPVDGVADKVATMLEAYATGTYTISGLLRLCEDIGLKSARGKSMQIQAVSKMLRYPIYAGLEQSQHTDNELIPAAFEGIITPATFYRNQELLVGNKNTAAKYKKNNPMFPLRRFVLCSGCSKPITGSSPTGGSGKSSPRYHCSRCRVPSIKADELHEQFLHLLSSLKPDPDMERFLKEIIVRVWRDETKTLANKQKKLHRALEQLTEQKNKTLELLVAGSITVDEKNDLVAKINAESENTKKELSSVSAVSDLKSNAIDYALQFMSNAPKIWGNASIEHQIIYQKLVFPAGITYDLSKNEFGTAKLSALYTLANIKKDPSRSNESLMVRFYAEIRTHFR